MAARFGLSEFEQSVDYLLELIEPHVRFDPSGGEG